MVLKASAGNRTNIDCKINHTLSKWRQHVKNIFFKCPSAMGKQVFQKIALQKKTLMPFTQRVNRQGRHMSRQRETMHHKRRKWVIAETSLWCNSLLLRQRKSSFHFPLFSVNLKVAFICHHVTKPNGDQDECWIVCRCFQYIS